HPRGFLQHGTTVDLHSSTSRTTEFAAGTFAAIITLSFRSGHQTSALGQPATLPRPTESERAANTNIANHDGAALRNLLVGGQVALVVLLVPAWLFLESLRNARSRDPGFQPTFFDMTTPARPVRRWPIP